MTDHLLPSWRPGATREAILAFLEAAADVPSKVKSTLLVRRPCVTSALPL